MRYRDFGTSVCLWLSEKDTREHSKRWPCSFLKGKRLFVQYDRNGLLDISINNGRGDQDCPANELSSIVSFFLTSKMDKDHYCWFVVVGQFQGA